MMTQPDLGPALEKGIWAAVIIAAVIVGLRVFAKIKIKRFGIDDGLMILAEVDPPNHFIGYYLLLTSMLCRFSQSSRLYS